jgi:TP901 family phage tail tape measure protein
MPDFAVSTVFKAKDKVSSTLGRMTKSVNRFGLKSSQAFNKASRSGSLFGKVVKGILVAGVLRRGISLLTSGFREATTEFISFDDAIKSATARMGDLKVGTIAGQKSIADLRKISRKLGAETEFTATQAAQGLEFLALAGFNAKQSIAALPSTIDFATVAGGELARAVDISTDAVGAFGLMTKDSVQLQKNFIRVMDLMAATTSSSNTDIEQLFESIKAGGSTFVNSGQKIETFTALVGKMASKGEKGEKAGTALRNVMLRLANPVGEAQKIIDNLGITVADQAGNFRDIIDIIGDFESKLKGMGTQQRAATLDTVFGKKAINAFNIILGEGSKSLRSYRDDLIDSGGAAGRMATIMRESLGKRLAALKSAAIEVGFKFLNAFKVRGKGAIEAATSALRNFDVTPVIEAVNGTIDVFKELFKTISPITTAISTLNKSDVVGLLKIAAAIKAISVAATLVNVALTASPLRLLLAGTAATLTGLMFLENMISKSRVRKGGFSDLHLFGEGGRDPRETFRLHQQTPPNRQDLIRSHQQVNLSGRIDLAGAPAGSTFEFSKAPGIDANVLGANP